MHKQIKIKALVSRCFTLAEVLITLTIVAVIATLVIRPLLLSSMDLQYASALRKEVSVVTNAFTRYRADTGGDAVELFTTSWNNGYKKLIPYLNVYRSCPEGGTCADYNIKNRVPVQDSQGGAFAVSNNFKDYPSAILNDGTTLIIARHTSDQTCTQTGVSNVMTNSDGEVAYNPAYNLSDPQYVKDHTWVNDACGDIIVDTNGRKQPNRFGLDVFEFSINIKGQVEDNQWTQVYGDTLYTLKYGKIIRPRDSFHDANYYFQ